MDKPAMHISIEGFDGVGKSTTCKLLAKRLGYEFVEKPLHYLFDDGDSLEEYLRIRDKVNVCPNRDFTATFYGLGSLYLYYLFNGKNIITDRHLCSNYAWSGIETNKDVYQLLLNKLGKPYLTVVLYADSNLIKTRLAGRDRADPDLNKVRQSEQIYAKMMEFCKDNQLNTLWLDTTKLSPEEVVVLIVRRLDELQKGAIPGFSVSCPEGVR